MKAPLFLRTADQLDRWLERFNPLRGATLSTLSSYFDEADEGRFTHIMWMARKMIRRDPIIRACLRRLLTVVQGLDWQVKVMEELPAGITPAMAEAQAAYLKGRYSAIDNLKQAYSSLVRADFLGFAHLEKHYDPQGRVIHLQPVPQWHWVRNGLYGPWLYNPSATPWGRDLRDINPADFIIHEVEDPWLEIALVSGLDLNQLERDMRGFCARYGIPNTFFVAGPGSTDDDLGELNDVASELAADGTGVLPNGADVKTHESASKGEIFEAAAKMFKEKIVLAATGGLLTMLTESGSGTLAGGAHSDSWRQIASGLAADVSEVFQGQMDLPWLKERFPGQPVAAYFELDFPEESTDRAELSTTAKTLKEAGYTIKSAWLSEELGIPFDQSSPLPVPGSPLTNREQRTANSEPSEMESLITAAIADSLDVMRRIVSPLSVQIQALIALAEDDKANEKEIEALALQVQQLLPELMTDDSVQDLAASIEAALGSAAAQGARDRVRKARKRGGAKS